MTTKSVLSYIAWTHKMKSPNFFDWRHLSQYPELAAKNSRERLFDDLRMMDGYLDTQDILRITRASLIM